jgi:hypothetical protein
VKSSSSNRDPQNHPNNNNDSEEELSQSHHAEDSSEFGGAAFGDAGGFGTADAFGSSSGGGTGGDSHNAFDNSGFGGFPSDFGSFPATTTTNTKTMTIDEMGSDTGYEPSSFGTSTFGSSITNTDTSPIENPPLPPKGTMVSSNSIHLEAPRPVLVQKSPPTAFPKANPLTGNVICCRLAPSNGITTKEWQLVEWNPQTQAQVMSAPLFSQDLQRKIEQKYKVIATAVDTVICLTVGVHQAGGYTRPRVAALMDVLVTDDGDSTKQREVLRIIAVWQWGYGSSNQMIQLQSLLSPPSGSDFSYNPTSLLVADSCVFVSGASSKGPCVFLSKPTVKETWSANFVGKEAARIASMAVTSCGVMTKEDSSSPTKKNSATASSQTSSSSRLPYLAIALTDGSLSIWTYEAATKVSQKNTSDTVRRLLYPLCKLEATKILRTVTPTDWETNTPTGK